MTREHIFAILLISASCELELCRKPYKWKSILVGEKMTL